MNVEWSSSKNAVNIQKHGIDFADAWEIWEAPMLTALDDRMEYGEDRWVGIGLLRSRVVVVVWTEPAEDTIRIISVRKALTYERVAYERTIQDRLGTPGSDDRPGY